MKNYAVIVSLSSSDGDKTRIIEEALNKAANGDSMRFKILSCQVINEDKFKGGAGGEIKLLVLGEPLR